MPSMVLFVLERVKPSLRGELTRWLLELKPGIFVGTLSARVRDKLWRKILDEVGGDGGAYMVRSVNNEQRFRIDYNSNVGREIRDFEGIQLVHIPHSARVGSRPKGCQSTVRLGSIDFTSEKDIAVAASGAERGDVICITDSDESGINSGIDVILANDRDNTKGQIGSDVDFISNADDASSTINSGCGNAVNDDDIFACKNNNRVDIGLGLHNVGSGGGINLFPRNFIFRRITFSMLNGDIKVDRRGLSSYLEYSSENVWDDRYLTDVDIICRLILSDLARILDVNNDGGVGTDLASHGWFGRKIVSLDLETTDYMPKALEGFVNVIGMATLDFRSFSTGFANSVGVVVDADAISGSGASGAVPDLLIAQAFNMLRKKDFVPHLLNLTWGMIDDADKVLVFNKDFDIKILERVIKENGLPYKLPSSDRIIDLSEHFINLKALEEELTKQTGFRRRASEKGKYSEYYRLFKGRGRRGIGKRIEPIGVYNLIDVLTPLYYYLLNF
ncbi:MAG: type I-E CRISPR-associated endoribonuclease Cas2e [Promethearchaeota archaeon]